MTADDRGAVSTRPIQSSPVGELDAVEKALADAITKAATAGAFDAVTALTAELRARREARAQVVSLDAERARRGK